MGEGIEVNNIGEKSMIKISLIYLQETMINDETAKPEKR